MGSGPRTQSRPMAKPIRVRGSTFLTIQNLARVRTALDILRQVQRDPDLIPEHEYNQTFHNLRAWNERMTALVETSED